MANNTITNNGKNASELIGLIDSRAKKVFSEENKGSLKTKIGSVISYDDANYSAVVSFPEEGENSNYTYYNKTSEVLAAGDTVRVYYTSNLATGWIGARGGEPVFKQIEIDGVGVGRPSPWDVTSEYFNAYGEEAYGGTTPTNIAGTDGQTGYYATARGFATQAKGRYSYAEGFVSSTGENAESSHVEGSRGTVSGEYSHVEGLGCVESYSADIVSSCNHVEGKYNTADNCDSCHVEGRSNEVHDCNFTHVTGAYHPVSKANGCLIMGQNTGVSGADNSIIGGYSGSVTRTSDSAKSELDFVLGYGSSVEDSSNCDVRGNSNTVKNSNHTSVRGQNCKSDKANYSAISGYVSKVENASHAISFGNINSVTKDYGCAIGRNCGSNGINALAYGYYSTANGDYDVVIGEQLITPDTGNNRFVVGRYNDKNIENMLFVIGNGDTNERSNAFSVDKEGNVYCKGTITSGGSSNSFVPYGAEQAVESAKSVFASVMEV